MSSTVSTSILSTILNDITTFTCANTTINTTSSIDNDSDNLARTLTKLESLQNFTANAAHIAFMQEYENGQLIRCLIDTLDTCITHTITNNNTNNNTDIQHQLIHVSLSILGCVLSTASDSLFRAQFLDTQGVDLLFHKLLSSPSLESQRHRECCLLALVEFLSAFGIRSRLVLDNTQYQWLFQLSLVVNRHATHLPRLLHAFCALLCRLYHGDKQQHHKQDDSSETDDGDDSDFDAEEEEDGDADENNIQSILNTLLFTGFLSTITKHTNQVLSSKTESEQEHDSELGEDVISMMQIIQTLMHCNQKKTCAKLIHVNVPKRMVEFLNAFSERSASHSPQSSVVHEVMQCLAMFYRLSPKHTLAQLQQCDTTAATQVFIDDLIGNGNQSKTVRKPLPIAAPVENNSEFKFDGVETFSATELEEINISEQESMDSSTTPPMVAFEEDSENENGSILQIQPPPLQSAQILSTIKEYGVPDNFSEMQLVRNAMNDIQRTISNLHANDESSSPSIQKYVTQHHAPRYSGISQQQMIDTETARIMTERREQKDEATEVQEEEDFSRDSSTSQNDENNMFREYSGNAPIAIANSNNTANAFTRVWHAFSDAYSQYIEQNTASHLRMLSNILCQLCTLSADSAPLCIFALIRDQNAKSFLVQFLSCLQIRDDEMVREAVIETLDHFYGVADDAFLAFLNAHNIKQHLCNALLVQLSTNQKLSLENAQHPSSNPRIDMKILQILAVNFSGRQILHFSVFHKLKTSVLSPNQHVEFVMYAMQVLSTIIDDAAENATKWICNTNGDGDGDDVGDGCEPQKMFLQHTVQFAVSVMQMYENTRVEIVEFARTILLRLRINVDAAVAEYSQNMHKNNQFGDTNFLTFGMFSQENEHSRTWTAKIHESEHENETKKHVLPMDDDMDDFEHDDEEEDEVKASVLSDGPEFPEHSPNMMKRDTKTSNFYAKLEQAQIRKTSDFELQKLKEWIFVIQSETDKIRLHGIQSNSESFPKMVEILSDFKRYLFNHETEHVCQCFVDINCPHILCNVVMITLMLHCQRDAVLLAVLDILLLYTNFHKKRRKKLAECKHVPENVQQKRIHVDAYIIKTVTEILSKTDDDDDDVMARSSRVTARSVSVLDKITQHNNDAAIQCLVDYGGVPRIFQCLAEWLKSRSNELKSLVVSSLNVLHNVCVQHHSSHKKVVCQNNGCQYILNILSPLATSENANAKTNVSDLDTTIVAATLKLLLCLTEVGDDCGDEIREFTSHLILVLINHYNILTVFYHSMELIQRDKKTLHLLMQLLLQICTNCGALSMDVQSWIIRIALEFSRKYAKSAPIQQFMLRIVGVIVAHNPAQNVQLVVQQKAEIDILETMKSAQYNSEIVLLVFDFLQPIINLNSLELNRYFVTECSVLKCIVHCMKNWYLNHQNEDLRVTILQRCCQIIRTLCVDKPCCDVANASHVSSSVIKLLLAHESDETLKKNISSDILRQNPYVTRISMLTEIVHCFASLSRHNQQIATKVAKHGIKTLLKTLEMHFCDLASEAEVAEKKTLLSAVISFFTQGICVVCSYILKYGVCEILCHCVRYFDENTRFDVSMLCELVTFLTLLLTSHEKSFSILETKFAICENVIHPILQKRKLQTQLLTNACTQYINTVNAVNQKRFAQQNPNGNGSPINLKQSITASAHADIHHQQQPFMQMQYAAYAAPHPQMQNSQSNPMMYGQQQMYTSGAASQPNLLQYSQLPLQQQQPINGYPPHATAAAVMYDTAADDDCNEMDSASQKQLFLSPQQRGLQARDAMDASLVQLLEQGTIMTKFPSIHTDTANYMQALSQMKGKYKLLRMAPDWQTLEFHNILCANGSQQMSLHATKPPKVLPIANMKCVESVFSENCRDLYMYALDKNGKEIAIKLFGETRNDTKRWAMALTQIIAHYCKKQSS